MKRLLLLLPLLHRHRHRNHHPLRIHPKMPFLESPELTAKPLSLLSSDNSAPWGETEYQAALLRFERLQEQARCNVYAACFCSTLTLLDKQLESSFAHDASQLRRSAHWP